MKFNRHIFIAFIFSIIFFLTSGFTVVGHRGDPTRFPEETIQSDDSAFNSGADYVELDLQLSKDGVLVVSHDDDLYRVTHTHAIVSQNNFETLHQLHYDNGEHVISLDELFKHYQNKPNTKFILETKVDHALNPSYALEDKIAATVKEYHMEKRIMIHSFSNASLFHLRKLLPNAYLIQIVGSLKRINFSILPQVNAVNVSSDIIQQHPFLIHWLHTLNRQVFVWAEMDESPSLWHWLINKNVDGVVTNFPATGFKYKLAKSGTQKYEINRTGTYFGKEKTPIMENPYVRIKQKHYVYPNQKVKVSYGVRVNDQLYYQIAEKTFISAEFVNFDLTHQDILPYENKQILVKPYHEAPIYRQPENSAITKKKLPTGQLIKILNFNGSPQNMWLYTKYGWIKANDILFYGFFDQTSFNQYQQLTKLGRYNNIALLSYRATTPVKEENYFDKMNLIKNIIK